MRGLILTNRPCFYVKLGMKDVDIIVETDHDKIVQRIMGMEYGTVLLDNPKLSDETILMVLSRLRVPCRG